MNRLTKFLIELVFTLVWMIIIQTPMYTNRLIAVLDGIASPLLRGGIATGITVWLLSSILLYVESIAEKIAAGDVMKRTGQSFWEMHIAVAGSIALISLLQLFGILELIINAVSLPYTEGALAVLVGLGMNQAADRFFNREKRE